MNSNDFKKAAITIIITISSTALIAAAKAYVDIEKIKTEIVNVYRSFDDIKKSIDNVADDVKVIKEHLINKRN